MALPTFQAAGTALAVGGAGGAVSWPTHVADDIALLLVATANQAVTLSTANGFVELPDSPQATGTVGGSGDGDVRLTAFWCRATSAAMSAPVVANPGNHVYAVILTFRGCATTGDPWNVTSGNVEAGLPASLTVTGDTTTVADCLVVIAVAEGQGNGARFSAWTNADLANVTERYDLGTLAGSNSGLGVSTGEKATAGSYGNTTATKAGSSAHGCMTIALTPPSAAAAVKSFSALGVG